MSDYPHGYPAESGLHALSPDFFSTETPLLYCPFDGDDEDKSGNGRHLQQSANLTWGPGATRDGRLARVLTGLGQLTLINASHNQDFNLQEITVVGRFRFTDAICVLAGMYSLTSGAEADNRPWVLLRGTSSDTNYLGGLAALWEYGAGSTAYIVYGGATDAKLATRGNEWVTCALRKKIYDATNTQLDLWVGRHKNFPATTQTGADSTGGANTLLYVGGDPSGTARVNGGVQDLMIWGSALPDEAIESGIISGGE